MGQINDINSGSITGLDILSGIKRSGNSKEVYLETLEAFIQDSMERIEELEICFKNKDFGSYAIHAHGIKSALYLAGADDLSAMAFELENAANNEDIDFIIEKNDSFITALSELRDNVVSFFDEPVQNLSEPLPENPGVDKADVILLREAIEMRDITLMNNTVLNLLTATRGTKENTLFRKISGLIIACEYEEALELLESLL